MRTILAFATVAACALTGCYEYGAVYAPEGATTTRGGVPAKIEKVPPEAPQGTVELASQGLHKLIAKDGSKVVALNVRITVDNEGSDQPWTFDTQQQLVDIPGAGRFRPIAVSADVQTLPVVTIGRRERHVIDLYYPVPPQVASTGKVPAFDVLWEVDTPNRQVAARERFDRLELEPVYAYNQYYWGGWGPNWWYDPLWAGGVAWEYQPVPSPGPKVPPVAVATGPAPAPGSTVVVR